jgi:hypothetical protein
VLVERVVIRRRIRFFRFHFCCDLSTGEAMKHLMPHNAPLLNTFLHFVSTTIHINYQRVIHNFLSRCETLGVGVCVMAYATGMIVVRPEARNLTSGVIEVPFP